MPFVNKDFRLVNTMFDVLKSMFGADMSKQYSDAVSQLVEKNTPWRLSEHLSTRFNQAKKIVCLSDLHIGAGLRSDGTLHPRDNFDGKKIKNFTNFLKRYGEEEDTLVLYLGDIFECWQVDGPRIVANQQTLLNQMAKVNSIYVVGNHDRPFAPGVECRTSVPGHPFFNNLSKHFIMPIGDKKVHFMHGHEFDPYNCGEDPSRGQAIAIMAGEVEDAAGGAHAAGDKVSVEDRLFGLVEKVQKFASTIFRWISYPFRLIAKLFHESTSPSQSLTLHAHHLQATAELKLKCQGTINAFDIVVMGHTHAPGKKEWYHNTGSWVNDKLSFIEIEKGDSDPTINHMVWKENHAELVQDPTLKA